MTYEEKLKQVQNVFQENGFSADLYSRLYERMSQHINQPFVDMTIQQVQERLTDYCHLILQYDIKQSETEHIFKRFPRLFFNNPVTVHQNIQALAKVLNKTEYDIVQRIKLHPETFLLKTEARIFHQKSKKPSPTKAARLPSAVTGRSPRRYVCPQTSP